MPLLEIVSEEVLRRHNLNSVGVDVFQQRYETEKRPSGVVVKKAQVFYDEYGGHFMELGRFTGGFVQSLVESGVSLNLGQGQANAATIAPGTERYGHLHREQDEMWIVNDGTMVLALYDMRADNETFGVQSRLVLHEGTGVYIPHGVVHGLGNYTHETAGLNYFTTHPFSGGSDTQEWRVIPKDPAFWDFARPDKI